MDMWVCLSSCSLGVSLRAYMKMNGCAVKAIDENIVVSMEERLQVGQGKSLKSFLRTNSEVSVLLRC